MGWGAAYAFYNQNRDWLDDPQDAHDILYGGRKKPKALKMRLCPICHKGLTTDAGRRMHMRDVHGLSKKEVNDALN